MTKERDRESSRSWSLRRVIKEKKLNINAMVPSTSGTHGGRSPGLGGPPPPLPPPPPGGPPRGGPGAGPTGFRLRSEGVMAISSGNPGMSRASSPGLK